MSKKRGIVWFRQDLRFHDNEALKEAVEHFDEIIPVFVFDERIFEGWQRAPFPKVFRTRLKFVLESVRDLREQLRSRGAELYIRRGKTEEIIYDLARQYEAAGVYCSRERMPVGEWLQDHVEVKLWSLGLELHYYQGKMLYHTSDLPFPIARMPDLFSSFRKETLQFVPVRKLLEMPRTDIRIPDLDLEPGKIPALKDFGYHTDPNIAFTGGERNALGHLEKIMAKTADGYEGDLRVSPWMAMGSLSPRMVYHRIDELPSSSEKLKKDWINKLLLRDYYWLKSSRNPAALFRPGGWINKQTEPRNWSQDDLVVWIRGETGIDFIDACMKCLFHTGFLNHGRRKAVARYLVEDMELDWQLGARYFESVMLDYDPCSNYGNWQRQAGISLDLKGASYYKLENMIAQEDPEGVFTEKWKNKTVDFDFLDQEVVI